MALVPEFDDYLRPAEARERFARVPQAEVVGVDGGQAPVGGGDAGAPRRSTRSSPGAPGRGPLPRTCPRPWSNPVGATPRRRWTPLTPSPRRRGLSPDG